MLKELETTQKSLTYAKAVNEALRRALAEDDRCLIYGEDVGKPGGVFGVTRGLKDDFGDRVFDTPISETAILGSALGAAMVGMRPIVEIMWIDFSLVAMDQIFNQIAKMRYISAGRLTAPLVIRTQQGVLPAACAQHAQNLEALYVHAPGLRVGLATTAQDAYSMLLAGFDSEDPVLIIENRGLYHGAEQEVVLNGPIEPVGGARTRREGSDITLLTWGAIQASVLEAATALASKGISAEVIDARWLNPFDWDTLESSVRKTRRLMVVHEANVNGGVGAEIAAQVGERLFGALEAPIARIGLPNTSIPAAPHLQKALYPTVQQMVDKACQVVAHGK